MKDLEKMSLLAQQALSLFNKFNLNERDVVSPLPRLTVLQYTCPTSLEATLYEPSVCLILQGRKETIIGDRVINFGVGESLIVSHDLGVISRVTKA